MADTSIPSYLIAADNHNIGNARTSWFSPESWIERIGAAGKYITTAIFSGANSFYNTGVTVGKWATGLDFKENPTDQWISSIDSDLGIYYRENQESVDLGGFILGAIVPGMGGVRVFNAGQKALQTAVDTGRLGGNLSKATGLLVPRTEKYIDFSIAEINQSVASFRLLNANTTQALARGVQQNFLEAAAFEVAVQASMFKSPILEEQDIWDIGSNILLGGTLGGVIGGAFSAAKTIGTIKRAVQVEDVLRRPFIERPALAEATPAWERIVNFSYDAEYSMRPALGVTSNFDVKSTLFADKITKNFNDIRSAIHDMVGRDDSLLGNLLANISSPVVKDGVHAPGFAQNYFQNFSGVLRVVRPTAISKEEAEMARALAKGNPVEKEVAARWVKLLGEKAGDTYVDRPNIFYLSDLHSGEKAVLDAVRDYRFALDKSWSTIGLTGPKAHLEAEARYVWADKLLKEIPEDAVISKYDIPVLERAYRDGITKIKVMSGEGPSLSVIEIRSRSHLLEVLEEAKVETANFHVQQVWKGTKRRTAEEGFESTEIIAKIANVKTSFLEGEIGSKVDDLFAMQSVRAQYLKILQDRGLSLSASEATVDPIFLPKYAKVVYETSKDLAATNPNILNAITFFKEQQKEYVDQAKRVVANIAGSFSEQLPDISDYALLRAGRTGSSAGLFSSENSSYGTLGSSMAFIGSVTRSFKQALRKNISDALEAPLVRLAQKPEAAFEVEAINQKVTRSAQQWVYRELDGEYFLLTKRAAKSAADEDGAIDFDIIFSQFPEDLIQIRNQETAQFLRTHIEQTGKRTSGFQQIRAAQGRTNDFDTEVYRPIRPDLKQYKHFAFVTDPRVTGSGHQTMIHAASEKELADLIDRVPSQYKVLTKGDVEEFKRARAEYEYARTLNEDYIRSDLANQGIFSNFFPKSDPKKIVDDILQQHLRESELMAVETVRLRYEPQFNLLEDLGKQYSKIDTSQFASRIETLEKSIDNPYFNYIKTALDISKFNEYPLIYSANKILDTAVSKLVGAVQNTFSKLKSPEELEQINALLDQHGMKPAFYDASLQALANHSAPRGELTKFVRKANSLLSLFTLGLDPLNALNNAVGSNILRMTELRHIVKAIEQGDTELAGELGKIAKIKLPGAGDEILAPTKLVARAIQNFWSEEGKVLMQKYRDLGLIKDRAEQLHMLVDDFTLKGTETVAELNKRMSAAFERAKKLAETGESATGNKLAEEFNRFISANVMDQITDLAVQRGLMSPAESYAYINTFVNRVEGNIIASQRPLIFQGPIGQAISLFQSYQFNLLQQLFRYVAEGSKKDLAMLAGLQSTMYGLQSLPAFQFMNVHIIGQMSGNKDHRDTYDAVYGITGRTAGDFILYGLPSNILQTNIYSRGDINPRQLTILPTALQEIPIVQGWGKFLLSIKETLGKVTSGGNVWESILQGLEHNGISRPLAGLAQTLQAAGGDGQVYSTTNKGSILYSNDLFSIATASRLAGGRPLDEAVVNDAMFRTKVYEASQRKDRLKLIETVKTSLIQGNEPSEEQILRFAQKYAETGGKQADFNKWMMSLYKTANVRQAEEIQNSLTNPFAYKMQLLMGGEDE